MKDNSTRSIDWTTLLKLLIFLQVLISISVIFNIPIARQILGFIQLTFVPGFVILMILKFEKLSITETLLFSVGLSLSTLMFVGLLINEICPLYFSKPLSILSLTIHLNLLLFLLYIVSWFRCKRSNISIPSIKISPLIIFFLCIPLLSVLGSLLVNFTKGENNFLILFTIALMSIIFIFSTLSEKITPSKLYPFILFILSIALLLSGPLVDNHLVGQDEHTELYVSKLTQKNLKWSRLQNPLPLIDTLQTNAMLSVTILPVVYSQLLGIELSWLWKLLYPFIFSLIPLGLYQIYSTQAGIKKKDAFLAALLFFSYIAGLVSYGGTPTPGKQEIATFFFTLLILVLLNNKFSTKRNLLLMIFGSAMVVSHYTTSYIFIFIIFFAWIYLTITKKQGSKISTRFVFFMFIAAFVWYIYGGESAPFDNLLNVGQHIYETLYTDFFNPQARGETVLAGLGAANPPSLMHRVSSIFFYTVEFFIAIGFVKLLFKWKKMDFDKEYVAISIMSMSILALCILLPNFANAYGAERFFGTTLIALAPLFVVGVKSLCWFITKKKIKIYSLSLILMILVPFFLFQVAFMYEVARDDPFSLLLSRYRMNTVDLYTRILFTQDIFGARWLSIYTNLTTAGNIIYSDSVSAAKSLTSYGLINGGYVRPLYNTTKILYGEFIYLSRVNNIDGVICVDSGWNVSDIASVLEDINKIYSNGECAVYKGVSG